MKFVIGVVLITVALIEARGIPKVQIYEIRDKGNNGIELKDLSSAPRNQQNVESQLLRLLSPKKQNKKENDVTQQLIEKLKTLKGEEGNRISDDTFVYILHDIINGAKDYSSSSEEVFVDKTRNDNSEQRIRNILETLLRQNKIKPKHKKRNPLTLRSGGNDRIIAPYPKDSVEYITLKPHSSDSD